MKLLGQFLAKLLGSDSIDSSLTKREAAPRDLKRWLQAPAFEQGGGSSLNPRVNTLPAPSISTEKDLSHGLVGNIRLWSQTSWSWPSAVLPPNSGTLSKLCKLSKLLFLGLKIGVVIPTT